MGEGKENFIKFHDVWDWFCGHWTVCLRQGWRELIVFSIDTWQWLALERKGGPLSTTVFLFNIRTSQHTKETKHNFSRFCFLSSQIYLSWDFWFSFCLYRMLCEHSQPSVSLSSGWWRQVPGPRSPLLVTGSPRPPHRIEGVKTRIQRINNQNYYY